MGSVRTSQLPDEIYAEAVVGSVSGESLLRSQTLITSQNVSRFHAPASRVAIAAERLQTAGFRVLDIGSISINIAAPPRIYEEAVGADLEIIERPVVKDLGKRDMAAFINSADGSPLGEINIAGVRLCPAMCRRNSA